MVLYLEFTYGSVYADKMQTGILAPHPILNKINRVYKNSKEYKYPLMM